MSVYVDTVEVGTIFFALLFVFILFFTIIIQYRRNGLFYGKEAIFFLAFIFYLEIAYFMTILPLPDIKTFPQSSKPLIDYMQLNPAYFINDITAYFRNHSFSIMNLLKAPPFFTTVFNIILLFPLGIFLKNLFNYKLNKIITISFLVSLSFELLQLSGLLFIYPHPYRLFDVDDLIMNTLGGLLGGALAGLLSPIFRKSKRIKEKIDHFSPTIFKQFFIIICDTIIVILLSLTTIVILEIIGLDNSDNQLTLLVSLAIIALYFIPSLFKRNFQTLMMRGMKFKLINEKDSIVKRLVHLVLLYSSLVFYGVFAIGWLNTFFTIINIIIIVYVFVSLFRKKEKINIIDRKLGFELRWNDYHENNE